MTGLKLVSRELNDDNLKLSMEENGQKYYTDKINTPWIREATDPGERENRLQKALQDALVTFHRKENGAEIKPDQVPDTIRIDQADQDPYQRDVRISSPAVWQRVDVQWSMPEVVPQGQTVVGIMPSSQPPQLAAPAPAAATTAQPTLSPALASFLPHGLQADTLAEIERTMTTRKLTLNPDVLAAQLNNPAWLAKAAQIQPGESTKIAAIASLLGKVVQGTYPGTAPTTRVGTPGLNK